jgi:hypothetical protein
MMSNAKTLLLVAKMADGSELCSNMIPYSDAILQKIQEDVINFYDGHPLVIWNKLTGALSYVHLRDVREVKILTAC